MSSKGIWTASANSNIHVIGIARLKIGACLPAAMDGELMKKPPLLRVLQKPGNMDQQQFSFSSSFDSESCLRVCCEELCFVRMRKFCPVRPDGESLGARMAS
jgi:hypothetical protein